MRWIVAAVVALLVVVTTDLTVIATRGSSGSGPYAMTGDGRSVAPNGTTSAPWFGLLEAQDSQLTDLAHSGGVSTIAVTAGWDSLEPRNGTVNAAALSALVQRVRKVSSLGYQVVLDLGLQYPPSWVFSLPGQTRFVNQYGDVWHAALSQDVPNSVFNSAVRSAEAGYIARLGTALAGTSIARVRIGGLLSGELRYPPATYNGRSDLIWDYDSAAQSAAPFPGWRPGSGSATEAKRSLLYYFDSLTNYLTWLMRTAHTAFPSQTQEVLFPSFGLRPGMLDESVAAGMNGTTNAERNGLISSGLSWSGQVAAVARTRIPAVVSSTWLDGPAEGTSVRGIAPVAYLALLARQYGLGVSGENTGGGGTAALKLSIARVKQYGLLGMMYMSGRLVATGQSGGVSLTQMNSAARSERAN